MFYPLESIKTVKKKGMCPLLEGITIMGLFPSKAGT
jgi:hypothetical protein